MGSKKQLAIFLSKLEDFKNPDPKLEQYSTDSNIGAEILWFAYINGDIKGKVIADLGCGPGILGIGALLLGAKKVIFNDISKSSLEILKKNLNTIENKNYEVINCDVKDFDKKADIVMQNPPFGAKLENRNGDKIFLNTAFKTADIIYSFHTVQSKKFIDSISKENKFQTTNYFEFNWPLKQTLKFHKKKIKYINVGCWRFQK